MSQSTRNLSFFSFFSFSLSTRNLSQFILKSTPQIFLAWEQEFVIKNECINKYIFKFLLSNPFHVFFYFLNFCKFCVTYQIFCFSPKNLILDNIFVFSERSHVSSKIIFMLMDWIFSSLLNKKGPKL